MTKNIPYGFVLWTKQGEENAMFITAINDRIMCKTNSGNKIYWMLTQENGAPNFELRYIEIPSNGKSSYGKHPHEHEVFVVQGKGKIVGENIEEQLKPGMAVFVPGNEEHQWINTETEPFGFICVVPKGAEASVQATLLKMAGYILLSLRAQRVGRQRLGN
ncbi:MAG: cupin domain-containing protein [Spirochaetia bacterium]